MWILVGKTSSKDVMATCMVHLNAVLNVIHTVTCVSY